MSAKTWFSIRASASQPAAADVSIHDEIGMWGISAKDFLRDLKALGKLSEINLSLHSPGGEVFEGWAIYNGLKATKAKINVRVEGLAASMASVIAMAGDTITMPRNAYMMIHNPWGLAVGDAADMRDLADLLDKLRNNIVNAYEDQSGLPRDEIIALMDAETWMDGEEAHARGFADVVEEPVALAALASFDTRRFAKAPAFARMKNESDPPASEPAPVEPPAPAAPDAPPVEPPPAPPADQDTNPQPPNPNPAPPVEPPAPAAAGFIERAVAALTGSGSLKAEAESLRLENATLKGRIDNQASIIAAVTAERDGFKAAIASLEAAVSKAEAEKKTVGQVAAELAASHGLLPDAQGNLPAPADEAGSILDQFEAIADPAERTAFFQKHKAAINAAFIASKKK